MNIDMRTRVQKPEQEIKIKGFCFFYSRNRDYDLDNYYLKPGHKPNFQPAINLVVEESLFHCPIT